jgi:hypothetical protein
MALTRLTDWNDGDVLTSAALEAEFDNIYTNALSLISPLTGNLAAGDHIITGLSAGTVSAPSISPTSDSNTGLYFSAADTVDVAAGGVRGLRVNTAATAVNYIDITPTATGAGPIITANGSDSNIGMRLRTTGTGAVLVQPGATTSLSAERVASAVNYVAVSGAATGSGPIIDVLGSDTNIDLNHDTKGTGVHVFKIDAVEKTRIGLLSKVPEYVYVTADQTLASSTTTLTNVTDLVYTLAASTQYFVKMFMVLNAADALDFKFGWTVPASCTMVWAPTAVGTGSGFDKFYWSPAHTGQTPDALLSESTTSSIASLNGTIGATFLALVSNSTNAGSLQLQFCQVSAGASTHKILKGSHLEIVKIQ